MGYRFLAELLLLLHLAFILFAVFGGIFIFWRRDAWRLHLPAAIWGFLVQFFMLPCPLTRFENIFRELAGESGYSGGFAEYYLMMVLYPGSAPQLHLWLAFGVVLVNLCIYGWYLLRRQTL